MDIVFLHGLRVETVIGVHAWEREVRQELAFDLDLGGDISRGAQSDALADVLDYEAVALRVAEITRASQPQLLESLAESLASALFEEFQVRWLRLRINKPGAVAGARDVGVVIERGISA